MADCYCEKFAPAFVTAACGYLRPGSGFCSVMLGLSPTQVILGISEEQQGSQV